MATARQTRKIPADDIEAQSYLHARLGKNMRVFLEVAAFGAAIGAQLGLLSALLPHAMRFTDKVDGLPGARYGPTALPKAVSALFSAGDEPLMRTLADLPGITERFSDWGMDFGFLVHDWMDLMEQAKPIVDSLSPKKGAAEKHLMAAVALWWAVREDVVLENVDFLLAEIVLDLIKPFDPPAGMERDADEHALAGAEYRKRLSAWTARMRAAKKLLKSLDTPNPTGPIKHWRWDDDADVQGAGALPVPPKPKADPHT